MREQDRADGIRRESQLAQQPPQVPHLAHEPGVDEHRAGAIVLDEQVKTAHGRADGVKIGGDVAHGMEATSVIALS